MVAAATPGRAVPLKVWRNKAEKTLEIKIGETQNQAGPSRRPDLDHDVTQGIQSRGVDRAIGR